MPAIWFEFFPIHDLPFGTMPPAAANVEFVKLDTSSAIVTSSRRSMSRLQETATSGSWMEGSQAFEFRVQERARGVDRCPVEGHAAGKGLPFCPYMNGELSRVKRRGRIMLIFSSILLY